MSCGPGEVGQLSLLVRLKFVCSCLPASFPNAFSSTAAAAAQLQQQAANSPAGKQTEGCVIPVTALTVTVYLRGGAGRNILSLILQPTRFIVYLL